MKEAPQRFKLVEDSTVIDPIIRQRRSRLVWAIIGIVLLFMLLNGLGIIQTGHFERDQAQEMKQLADEYKEFWIEWDRTFGGEK